MKGMKFMQLIIGLIIPFIGTTLGSAMVFLMKNKINNKIKIKDFKKEASM